MCNPNNPTGTAITTSQLDEILAHCKKNNTAVMVDETYIEFSDKNLSEICAIPLTNKYDNLFVIKGGKFFATPGLRLGYGISSSKAFKSLLKIKILGLLIFLLFASRKNVQ